MDKDHNRSVVTFVGDLESVIEAAFNSCKKAAELIDLRNHKGEHQEWGDRRNSVSTNKKTLQCKNA